MKFWTCSWLIAASLLFPQAVVGKRIAVVIAMPSEYSNDTVGFTVFGNKSESIEQGDVKADVDVREVVFDVLSRANHDALLLHLPKDVVRKVEKRKFIGGWSGVSFVKSSKKWLRPHLTSADADLALLVTTFPRASVGQVPFNGFGVHTRKGALGIPDTITLYAHVSAVLVSIDDWQMVGGSVDMPCWAFPKEVPTPFDEATGRHPLLEKVRAITKAATEVQTRFALYQAGLTELLPESAPAECGTVEGSALLSKLILDLEGAAD